MISYQIYKMIHIGSIFLFLTGVAVLLLSERKSLGWKILTGVASFFILFGGMGLMARLMPGQGFQQPWIQGKLVLWLVLTGLGHLVAKRFPAQGLKAYWVVIILATISAYMAIYKPGHRVIEAPAAASSGTDTSAPTSP
jgi:uncharacterized membrane protein SirB2